MCSVFTLLPDFAKPVEVEVEDKSPDRVTSPVPNSTQVCDLSDKGEIISNFFDQMKARTLSIISEHGKEVRKLRETIEFQEKAIEIMKSFMTDEQKIQFTKQISELESTLARQSSLTTHPPTPTPSRLEKVFSESSLPSEEVFSPAISPRATSSQNQLIMHIESLHKHEN